MTLYDDLSELIYSRLPKRWDFHRKAALAGRVIDLVRAHVDKLTTELNEMDKVVSKFAPSDDTLRIKFPTLAHRDEFVAWLCDGGGEQSYFTARDFDSDRAIVDAFDYHSDNCVYARYSGNDPGDMIVGKLNED